MTDDPLEELARELAAAVTTPLWEGPMADIVLPFLRRAQQIQPTPSASVEKLAQKCADDFYGLDFYGLGRFKKERIRLARHILPFLSDLERRAKAEGVKEGLAKFQALERVDEWARHDGPYGCSHFTQYNEKGEQIGELDTLAELASALIESGEGAG